MAKTDHCPSLIERDTALAEFGVCLKGTEGVLRDALKRVRTTANELDLIDRDPSCQAKMMQCYSVQGLVRFWAGNTRIRFLEHGQQDLFVIDNRHALRIKKFDAASRSAANDTDQDRAFRGQQSFDGVDQSFNFELGYVLNASETEIVDVRVSCVNGRGSPYWWQSIEAPADNVYDLFQGQRPKQSTPATITPIADVVTVKPKEDGSA